MFSHLPSGAANRFLLLDFNLRTIYKKELRRQSARMTPFGVTVAT